MYLNPNQPVCPNQQASKVKATQNRAVSSGSTQPVKQGNVLFQAKKADDPYAPYANRKVVPDLNMKRVIPSFILGGAALIASCLFLAPILPALIFAAIPASILIGTFWLAGIANNNKPSGPVMSAKEAGNATRAYQESERLKWQERWNKLKSFFVSG